MLSTAAVKRVEFLFDYASPWAYLASEILARKLPGAAIDHRPIYLRGLETFSKGMPFSAAKLSYIVRDFLRCAAHEEIAAAMPAQVPVNGLYAVRGALHLIERGGFAEYHQRMFRAAWRDGRDVSRKEVVVEIAGEAGQDPAAFAAALDAPALKDRLKRDTAAAEARGVFGVPTFFVGEELFWGHDRLDYVARALAR